MDPELRFVDPPHRREWLFLSLPLPQAQTLQDSLDEKVAGIQESMAILLSSAYRLIRLYATWNLEGGTNRPEVERCVRERQVKAEAQYLIDEAFPDWIHKYSQLCKLVEDLEPALDYVSWHEKNMGYVVEMLSMVVGIIPPDMLPDIPLKLRSFINV